MSELGSWKVGTSYAAEFWVYDQNDAPVRGLSTSSFITRLTKDQANSTAAVTIVEVDSAYQPGKYSASFTPDANGRWSLLVQHVIYNPRGWQDDVQVFTRSLEDLAFPLATGQGAALDGSGRAGVDWSNVGAPTTALDLANTTIKTSQQIGSVSGAVGSVTSPVTVGTNNDKTGYALSAAGVQAIWDALTSALTTVGSIGKLLVTNVDAAISSRLASSSYASPPSASTIAQAVWDALTSALTTVGSIGKLLVTNVDAAISSRPAGSDYSAARAAKLDNLDAAITTRATPAQILATPSNLLSTDAAGRVDLAKWIGVAPNALIAGRVDANAQVVGDKAGYSLATAPPTLAAIVAGVWDELQAGHVTAGTFGKLMGYLDAAISTVPSANANADALLDRASAVDAYTVRQVLRLLGAACAGKSSQTGNTMRALDDSKARITATVDGDGNRTAITLDAS